MDKKGNCINYVDNFSGDVLTYWCIQLSYNGILLIYEREITSLDYAVQEAFSSGCRVTSAQNFFFHPHNFFSPFNVICRVKLSPVDHSEAVSIYLIYKRMIFFYVHVHTIYSLSFHVHDDNINIQREKGKKGGKWDGVKGKLSCTEINSIYSSMDEKEIKRKSRK